MKKFLKNYKKKHELVDKAVPVVVPAIDEYELSPTSKGRQRSISLRNIRGLQSEQNSISSNNTNSITVDSRETFVERLRNQKATRDKMSNHDRVKELRDQNQYLIEKVQFLKSQKMRNENEIIRRDDNNKELKKIHDSYVTQLQSIEELIEEWQSFHTSVTEASESMSSMSQSLGECDTQVSGHEIV